MTEESPDPGAAKRRKGNGYRRGPVVLRGAQVPATTSDERLLQRVDKVTWLHDDPWRVMRITSEFVEGFGALAEVGPAVSVFGSARIRKGDPEYALAQEIASGLVRAGYAVITGGGPGVMEAGNRGATDVDAASIGFNIVLPHEQAPNLYVTPEFAFNFHYFATRKIHFLLRARAVAIFPGGFGTLDEFFETLTLIQTGRMDRIPLLLFGIEFWRKVINFEALAEAGTISPEDAHLFTVVDTAEEGWEVIRKFYELPEITLEA